MKEKHLMEVDIEDLVKAFRSATYGEYSDADEMDLVWTADERPKSLNEVLDELENDVNPKKEVVYEQDGAYGEWEADEIAFDDDDLTSEPF